MTSTQGFQKRNSWVEMGAKTLLTGEHKSVKKCEKIDYIEEEPIICFCEKILQE